VQTEAVVVEVLRSGALFPFRATVRRRIDPEIGAPRTRSRRADAVAPVVAVGKAAARPADDAGLQRLEFVEQRLANAADVGNLRVLADPDAVVDDAAEVFDEVTAEVGCDAADRFVEKDVQPPVDGLRRRAARRLRECAGGSAR
jgi:hypothetical protein